MRIALFGGSYDPPHRGHIAIAQAAVKAFALDQVLFAPAGRQPLKQEGHAASWEDRLAMVALACADSDPGRFRASTLDRPHLNGSANYTVDTLELLRADHPGDRLFALAGADSFRTIGRWRSAERLFELAEWIVVSRPGIPLELPPDLALPPALERRVHLLDSVHEEVAATSLRHRLLAGDPCGDLLSPAVSSYIERHGLYRVKAE